MQEREITPTKISGSDKNRWTELLKNSQFGNYQNSYEYTYAKNEGLRETETYIFSVEGEDVAGVHYSLKSALHGFVKTADILSGIVFEYTIDEAVLRYILQHFLSWATKKRAAICRISPWFPAILDNSRFEYADNVAAMFHDFGFQVQNQGRSTYWIDLTQSKETLLKKMNAGTRRKIKKGMQADTEIKRFTAINPEAVQSFWELYAALGKKKGFDTLSEKRFKREVNALLGAQQATLLCLYYQEQIINASLVTHLGMGMYYHGAVNHEINSSTSAPSSGHLVHWHMIEYLKEKGLKYYDMAYCPGPSPLKEHPMFDMWRFKHGFGGQHVQFLPTFIKPLNAIAGRLLMKYLKQ